MKSYAIVFSLIAFALSVMAFFACGVSASVENGALALIGICATLIVGISIVNEVRMHELEKKFKKIEEVEKNLEYLRVHSNIAMRMSWGFAYMSKMPCTAFLEFENAYKRALKSNDMHWIDATLQCMEEIVKIKKSEKSRIEEREALSKRKIKAEVPDEIQEIKAYKAFKNRTKKIYSDMFNIINTNS